MIGRAAVVANRRVRRGAVTAPVLANTVLFITAKVISHLRWQPLFTAVPSAPERGAYADAVLMFGAHGIVPCMNEVRSVPELGVAAAADRIVLPWIDRSSTPPPTTTGFTSLHPDTAGSLAIRLEGDGYGLPFSVTFDSDGAAFAVRRSSLRPVEIAAMRSQGATPANRRKAGVTLTHSRLAFASLK